MSRIDDALSRGFDAGNYACAYVSEDLAAAREAEESEEDGSREGFAGDAEALAAFDAAFTIGFFGSFELGEIADSDYRDELLRDERRYGSRMRALGINAAPRHLFCGPAPEDRWEDVRAQAGISWRRVKDGDRDFCVHAGPMGLYDCGMPAEDHPREDEVD